MINPARRIYIFFLRCLRLFSFLLINPKFSITILNIIYKYFLSILFINRSMIRKFAKEKNNFVEFCNKQLQFNHRDLFSNNIPSWMYIFEKYSLKNKKMDVLEIGSFEGRSSVFLLKKLDGINLTCVDTFKPFHELQNNNSEIFDNIFNNFKKNTNTYSERLNIIKNTSLNFFTINKKNFDFIYVDGSHEYVDVKKDADEAFKIIKKDGIIIFDDFLWQHKQNLKKSITYAIIEFLYEKRKNLKILYSNYQIIVQKI